MLNPKQYLGTFDKKYGSFYKLVCNDSDPSTTILSLSKKTMFVVNNLLHPLECPELIKRTSLCYENIDSEFLATERRGKRVLSMDSEFAAVLYARLWSSFLQCQKNERPCGFGTEGIWVPHHINQCMRYSVYNIGDHFAPHRDATYIESAIMRSIWTIIIYLNDDFEGGHTIFYKTPGPRKLLLSQNDGLVSDEMKLGHTVRLDFKPKTGTALVFNHNLIHSGDIILSGVKYILRTDVVFMNTTPPLSRYWLRDPNFILAVKLFREAMNKELDGDLGAASILYQKELVIRQCYGV